MSEKQLKLEILLSAIDKATAPIKQLMASSNGLSKEVKSLRDKMRELDKTQSQMDSYRKVSSQLGVTNAALKTAQEKVKALAGQMNTASEPTKALSKAFDAAKKAAGELKTQAMELSVKQQRMRETLHVAGVETKNLAQHQRTLRDQTKATSAALDAQTAKLKARNQVLAQKQAVKARYDSGMAQRDKLAGSGMAMSGAGAVAGAAVLAPAKAFAEAEDASTQLKVAMMGAGGVVAPEFAKVSEMAAKFGAELPGTTAQFTDMMRVLVQKGMDAKTVIGGAGEATANLSILTKTGFSETADAISVLQDSMGVADKDMVAAADSMQRLYNVGMKVGDIREGFKAMGPALTYLKKGGLEAVQALSPLLAITNAAGIDAGSAGNAYNKIIRGSVDKEKVGKANAELEGTGIKLDFVDAQGNFAGVNNMVSQIMKIKNLSSDQTRKTVVEKIFGSEKEVAETLDALMKAGVPGIEAMKKKLDAQASMQERIKAQLGTLKNLWDAAGGSFNALLVALGEAFAPQIKSLVQGIGDLSDKMTAWAKAHPMIAGGIMRIIAAVAIVLTLFGALTLALAGLMGPMLVVNAGFVMIGAGTGTLGARLLFLAASAFPSLTTAAVAFGAALMATPIGWIAAGIAAIAVAGLVLYRYWEPLGAFLSGVWDGFAAGMRTALPAMQPMIQAVSALAAGVANLIGPLSSTSQELGTAASMGAALGTAIAAMVDFALTPIKLLLASLSAVAAAAVALSNGDFSGAAAAAKNAFTSTAAGQSALAQDDSDAARMAARAPKPLSTAAEKLEAIKSTGSKNGGPTSQNVTVNVTPTPGMNEQALAKVVKKEVQSALANQPANNRAALYDRD